MIEDPPELPSVSIVIPCFNGAEYLIECLQSVIAQTFEHWEAIVVDDASTQGDINQIIDDFGCNRIRMIKHDKNRGLGAARNTGFKAASAQLVLPLDSDDCLLPEFLEETIGILRKYPDVDCVFTDFQLFGSSNEAWRFSVKSARDMLTTQWIPGAGTLMRKQVWRITGGYAEMPQPLCGNEDWDFWISAMQYDVKAIHIPKTLYLYRRNPETMSVTTLQFYDYLTRESIYRRHKALFDSHMAGNRFRVEGYLNSSDASLKRGKRVRAAWLALHAYMLAQEIPQYRRVVKLMLRSMCPDALRPISRRVVAFTRSRLKATN